jgi:anti-anti-sigma factor
MNSCIQLIPVSEYDRIPLKAIETLLTAYSSKPIPELNQELTSVEQLRCKVYPHLDEVQYAKRVEAQFPGYYGEFALKPKLLDFERCTEHQLDQAFLNNQEPIVIYNVVPSKLAKYLDASGVSKLPSNWWQVLPPDVRGCDLAISDLKCLIDRKIVFHFLVPDLASRDWEHIFANIDQSTIDFIRAANTKPKVFSLIDSESLKYTRKDGLSVESISSVVCRGNPNLREALASMMNIFMVIKSRGGRMEPYVGVPLLQHKVDNDSSQNYYSSHKIQLDPKLDQVLVGNRQVHANCEVFEFLGTLDAFSEPSFRMVMDRYIDQDATHLILDLAHISFVDSSGLGALMQVVKKAHAVDSSVQIITSTAVARIINLLQLQQFFSLRLSVNEAIASLS